MYCKLVAAGEQHVKRCSVDFVVLGLPVVGDHRLNDGLKCCVFRCFVDDLIDGHGFWRADVNKIVQVFFCCLFFSAAGCDVNWMATQVVCWIVMSRSVRHAHLVWERSEHPTLDSG